MATTGTTSETDCMSRTIACHHTAAVATETSGKFAFDTPESGGDVGFKRNHLVPANSSNKCSKGPKLTKMYIAK